MKARAMELFLAVVAGLILGADVRAAQATVIEWHLQNVRFDDRGSATGFISLDVDHDGYGPTPGSIPEFVDWDIKVRGGNTANFPPFEYTPASTFGAFIVLTLPQEGGPGWDDLIFSTGQRRLELVARPQLTDVGGTVVLNTSQVYGESRESWNPLPTRSAFGELTAVPEPSKALLLALGLGTVVGFSALRKPGNHIGFINASTEDFATSFGSDIRTPRRLDIQMS
jgi:hypothetical protein